MQIAGASALEIAAVTNSAPSSEYGVVTRNIPSGTQPVSAASLPLPSGAATETTLSAVSTVEGAVADAIVAAGATGSISAKLRRVTQGLEDLKTLIVLAA